MFVKVTRRIVSVFTVLCMFFLFSCGEKSSVTQNDNSIFLPTKVTQKYDNGTVVEWFITYDVNGNVIEWKPYENGEPVYVDDYDYYKEIWDRWKLFVYDGDLITKTYYYTREGTKYLSAEFKYNSKDERFNVNNNTDFAIDPTNKNYKKIKNKNF